jgi:hypothetical protein
MHPTHLESNRYIELLNTEHLKNQENNIELAALTADRTPVKNMAILAAGLFLLIERDNVNPKWKTALTVSGMVCFIAAVHYYYERKYGCY